MALWLPTSSVEHSLNFDVSDFYEVVREIGGDIVEEVQLIDDFIHPSTGRRSHCYRYVLMF